MTRRFLFLLIVVAVGAALYFMDIDDGSNIENTIITDCTGANERDFKCWRDRYQRIVKHQSPKEALGDVEAQYEKVSYIKAHCHQITHVIGRAAGKKYPELREAFERGDDFCASGYYHGVMESVAAQVGPEKIDEQITDICAGLRENAKYKLVHHNCTHGLGHGLMAVRNNELFASLRSCDELTDRWEQRSCYGGVFMENIMTEFTPGSYTKYLKQNDPIYPCNE